MDIRKTKGYLGARSRVSRPMFPEYAYKPVDKEIGIFDGNWLFTLNSRYQVANTKELIELMSSISMLVMVNRIVDLDLDLLIQHESTKVLCDRFGKITMVRVKAHKHTSWIIEPQLWDKDMPFDMSSVARLTRLFNFVGVGVCVSPSSLGRQTMSMIYKLHNIERHTSVSLGVESYLLQHGFGGMAQTFGGKRKYKELSQVDMTSAFTAKFMLHPDGAPSYKEYPSLNELDMYDTYFMHVDVTLDRELPLGIVPVRKERGRITYPSKGSFETYLWKEQVDLLRSVCNPVINFYDGFAWDKMTTDNALWAEFIYTMRRSAPKDLEPFLKKAAVAAIGRFASSRTNFVLVPEWEAKDDDVMLSIDGEPSIYYIREEYNSTNAIMPHWQRYTVQSTTCELARFAYSHAERGDLVMLDHDGILTKSSSLDGIIQKHTPESIVCPPGTWLWRKLHNVKVHANRIWTSDEEPFRYGGKYA
jgi:hypothetical protein